MLVAQCKAPAVVCTVLLTAASMLTAQQASVPASRPQLSAFLHQAAETGLRSSGTGLYVGPGSCSAVACHGGIQPRSVTKVLQNESSTWVSEDRHAKAYAALTGPQGVQMARILKIGPADKAQRCLVCHALSVPPRERARVFDISEGVSCENCHGPASAWLGPHIEASAQHARMVSLGLVDNKNLVVRAERCLTCHLGSGVPGMQVDHEMIAAGHPDLTFELDSYTAVEPPHWLEKAPNAKEAIADPLFGVRAWAVGQAVQLRESMLRLERRANDHAAPWPEFSEMDCFTCHHSLTGYQNSWRQKEGYPGRRPGDPPYNEARFVVFRHLALEADPSATHELDGELQTVARLVTSMSSDRARVAEGARGAATHAAQLVTRMQAMSYDRERNTRLLLAISADADAISEQGERSAEQAAMTLDSLYIANARAGAVNESTRQAVNALLQQLNNPSAYNAPQFAAQMRKVHDSLR